MAERTPDAEQDRRHLRAVLDTAPECIKLISRDGRVIDMNPAGLAMIDAASLDDVRGESIIDLIVPEHRSAFERLLAAVFAGERSTLAFEILGLRGRRLWMDSHGAPLWRDEAHGEVEAALFVTRDVTQRVAVEGARRALEEQLLQSQKMEAVGRLAGGIAHDFNNLLTVIQGQISLVMAMHEADHELAADLQPVADAAERAAALTRQLLTFSRRQVKQARPLDLAVLVRNLSTLLRRVLGEDVVLETRIAESMFVNADPTMIEQVILNLSVNARDAMPFGGRLMIGLDRVKAHVRLTVSDTGSGISEEDLPRVFEPFFTTKEVGHGSGLGLATVFGIVEQHDGQIEVESTLGRGTTFRVLLPAAQDAAAAAPTAVSHAPALVGGRETILLVEDEQAVRELAAAILRRFGYRVLEADSGARAVEVWQDTNEHVDLLLTDLVMPGEISGVALADRLRADRPSLRVAYMSGHASDVVQRRLGSEPDRLLQKPFEMPTLLAAVRQALDEPANITT